MLFSVPLSSRVHPDFHFFTGITGLMVTPVTINQSAEANGNCVEVGLETCVVRSSCYIFIDDNLWPTSVEPIIHLPRIFSKPFTNQNTLLLLDTNCICTNPKSKANHFWLVDDIVIKRGSQVHSHWPNFLILRVAIWVNGCCRISVWRTTATRPVHTSHVEVDVIGHHHIRIIFLHIIIGPVIAATLATFLT